MQDTRVRGIERSLIFTLCAASAGFVLLFLYTSLRRMSYPFSFDQVEGGMVTSVWRVARGLPLYVAPSTDFVPYLYAPLYFYVAAAASKLAGIGYAPLRLVSILGTVGALGMIYALIRRETRSGWAALSGAGLYAACYHPLEAWLDMGRVDALFVFTLLVALYCTRHSPILLAVAAWIVAAQVKQTVLPVAILVLLANWQNPRRLVTGVVALVAGFTGTVLMINHHTNGWYTYYLFRAAKALPWIARGAVLYVPVDLFQPLALALLIVFCGAAWTLKNSKSTTSQFYLFASLSIYASIWYLRSHAGSAVNTLMPAYAWTAVLFGISLHRVYSTLNASTNTWRYRTLLLGAATVQLAMFSYNPGRYVPSKAQIEARLAFERQLASLPGDIYVVSHSYDAMLAGKKPHAVIDAFGLLQEGRPSPVRDAFLADFRRSIDSHRFSGFVLDAEAAEYAPGNGWMPADFTQQYPVRVFAESAFAPGPQAQSTERWIYLQCSTLSEWKRSLGNLNTVVYSADCPGNER